MKRSFIREILDSINAETISFAGGLPDEKLFPVKDIAEAGAKVLTNPSSMQYMSSGGLPALKEKIADRYNDQGFPTEPANLLITTGSQQGLYVIAKYFQNRPIVIEEPSYLGAVNIFAANGLRMTGVPLLHSGVDAEAFAAKYPDAGLTYLIPDFQNPRGSFYDRETRLAAAETIRRSGGWLIEDAPYSELYFQERGTSISSLIPGMSFHLGSFSKTFAPGMRIGWIRTGKDMIRQLTAIKETMDLHSCSISQHIINEYLQMFPFEAHLNMLRKAYGEKMRIFADALKSILPSFSFGEPKGGMFIYGSLPGTDSFELVHRCMKNNVVYVPGSEFYTDGRKTDEIRFNFTHSSPEKILKGLEIIRDTAGL